MRFVSSLTAKVGAYADGAKATTSGGCLPSFRIAFTSGVRYVVFFCRVLLRNRAFADSIEFPFPVEIILVRVVAHTLTHGDGGLFRRVRGVHIHHTNILFHEDCPGIFEFFSQAKVPEKYGSQEIKS